MTQSKTKYWLLGLFFAFSTTGHATLILTNGAPDQVSGDNMSDTLMAEDFTIGSSFLLSNIRFFSIQSAPGDYRGSVYWEIRGNSGGLPGSVVQGGVNSTIAGVATGNATGFGYAEYVFDIPVSFQLSAGTYWLTLHNGVIGNNGSVEMLWATTAVGNGTAGVYSNLPLPGSPTWISTSQEHAFLLEGSPVGTPEPSSILMMVSGLAFVAFRQRKN